MITTAGEANLLSGFKPAASAPTITHLQFADDTLLFCEPQEDQIKNIIAILRCYEAISGLGLKVNFFKSALFGVFVEDSLLERLTQLMGCNSGSLPSSYLGLPLSEGRVPKSLWSPVVEKLEKKLATWKSRYLSLRGRITLIQSLLANLPIYFMSKLKCPGCNAIFFGTGRRTRRNST